MDAMIGHCCGGERFVKLPGLGILHLPHWDNISFSFAFPITMALYVGLFLLARFVLRRTKYATPVSIAFSVVALPALFMHPKGLPKLLMVANGLPSEQSFLNKLRDKRLNHHPETRRIGIMSEESALELGQRIVSLKDRWALDSGGAGTPHFTLGRKYGLTYRNGSMQSFSKALYTPDPNWDDFQSVYEKLKTGMEAALGLPVRLHKEMWAPVFQIHMQHRLFELEHESHNDPLVRDTGLLEYVDWNFGKELGDSWRFEHCHWDQQSTFVLSVLEPHAQSSVKIFRYSNDTSCSGDDSIQGPARSECAEFEQHFNRPGTLTMFGSQRMHLAQIPFRPVPMPFDDLRIVMVGFTLPCMVSGRLERQVIGAIAR